MCEAWEKYKEELKDDVSLSVQSVKKFVIPPVLKMQQLTHGQMGSSRGSL
jgi:hypothetical protein